MKYIICIFWWSFLTFSIFAFGIFGYFGSIETYIYVTRSEEKAQAAAQIMFEKTCSEKHLDPASFRGPERPSHEQDKRSGQYTFVWTRKKDETVYVSVLYLPYDIVTIISRSIIDK